MRFNYIYCTDGEKLDFISFHCIYFGSSYIAKSQMCKISLDGREERIEIENPTLSNFNFINGKEEEKEREGN